MKKALGKRIKRRNNRNNSVSKRPLSVFITISIVAVLAYESFGFLKKFH